MRTAKHLGIGDRTGRRAFTLVEILFVVLLLGVIASIVLARAYGATDDSRRSVFAQNLRSFQQGLTLYQSAIGLNPPDGTSGVCPTELRPYVNADQFDKPTPIGGVWDVETNASGVSLAVGVHFDGTGMSRDDAYMAAIDQLMDDGDLATGGFRKLAANRYYVVLDAN